MKPPKGLAFCCLCSQASAVPSGVLSEQDEHMEATLKAAAHVNFGGAQKVSIRLQ